MLVLPSSAPRHEEMERLPKQTPQLVMLFADRYWRATSGMEQWATKAKECIDFVEGKQWSETDLQIMEAQKRPAMQFNRMNNLVRMVLGYHRNNRSDRSYLPGWDGSGNAASAESLTRLAKLSSEANSEIYRSTEVFMDGLITGRGFYDRRLSFEKNILGELKIKAKDPFSIKIDPEAQDYDPNEDWGYVIEDRWVSIEEVEYTYGKNAAALLWGLLGATGYAKYVPNYITELADEITPWRSFGGALGDTVTNMISGYVANCYDPGRKVVKLLDMQHVFRRIAWNFVDLETGAKEPIPDTWDQERVTRVLEYAAVKYAKKGKKSPLTIARLPTKRVRWSTMVGDLIVYDDWSRYESYTLVPFFPWFRRGKTRGMAEDLIDPQKEKNKRRNANIDIVTRTAHSGWKYHKSGMSEEGKIQLERFGAVPGINIEWQGELHMEPKKIEPSTPPMAFERLEEKSEEDMKEISGINDSAMGFLDRVQSGRAIEARQRQAVLAIQTYMDNEGRTHELNGRKDLEIFQNHYTEERLFAVQGDEGEDLLVVINKRIGAGEIANNITDGSYRTVVDVTPAAASFAQAQFDELILLVEKGLLVADDVRDIAVEVSTLPQKELIKSRTRARMQAMGIGMPPDSNAPPGAPPAQGAPGSASPAQGGAAPGQQQPGGRKPAPAQRSAQASITGSPSGQGRQLTAPPQPRTATARRKHGQAGGPDTTAGR